MGSDRETRKSQMHLWMYRETSEHESDTSDTSDSSVRQAFDRPKIQKWLDDVSEVFGENFNMSACAI